MSEYIDREKMLTEFDRRAKLATGDKTVSIDAIRAFIANRPLADVKPVAYGQIIETCESGKSKRVLSCCGMDCTQLTMWMIPDYCPYCGAKVDEHIVQKWREKYE